MLGDECGLSTRLLRTPENWCQQRAFGPPLRILVRGLFLRAAGEAIGQLPRRRLSPSGASGQTRRSGPRPSSAEHAN